MAKQSQIQRTTKWVLCFSGFAAVCAILGLVSDYVSIGMMGALAGAGRASYGAYIGGVIAVLIPCCGWMGARRKNSGELCFFGSCNYLMGCCDCLWFGFLCTLLILVGAIQAELAACHLEGDVALEGAVSTGSCTLKDRQAVQEFCRTANQAFVNASIAQPQDDVDYTKASKLFVDTKCLETLHTIAAGVLVFVVIGLVLRCCSMGFHCVSGYCGFKLRDLIDDDRDRGKVYQPDSDSEDSVSSTE